MNIKEMQRLSSNSIKRTGFEQTGGFVEKSDSGRKALDLLKKMVSPIAFGLATGGFEEKYGKGTKEYYEAVERVEKSMIERNAAEIKKLDDVFFQTKPDKPKQKVRSKKTK